MIAVDVPEEILGEMVELATDLSFTNFNSPHQTVVGGSTQAIERFKEELDNRGYWNRILPVSMAFHSPIMKIIRDELGDYLEDIAIQAPRIPVLSNTTRRPYPDEPAEIKKIIIAHLESPVHWQSNVTTLRDDYQCNLFVEIGPQDTLCRLVADIAPQASSLPTCSKEREVETLKRAIAELYAIGCINAPRLPAAIQLHANISTPPQEALPLPPDTAKIGRIIQREITSFALQGVEKFLKPAILKAIGAELGYACSPADLEVYLGVSQANPQPSLTIGVPSSPLQAAEPQTPPITEDPILEEVIGIIIEATGYEREEIEPGMDIRQDLSIRSSRLPVIMDAAEKSFNIVISLEDFLDVRTIGDFTNRVKEVMVRQGAQPGETGSSFKIQGMAQPKAVEQGQPLPVQRLVLREKRLEETAEAPLGLGTADNVAILCLGKTPQGERLSSILSRNHNCRVTLLCLDLSAKAMEMIAIKGEEKYTGLIILTDRDSWLESSSADPISLCTTIFTQIQNMLQSPLRRFCIHLRYGLTVSENEEIVAQGVLGTLLAAAIEYRSVLFRSITTPTGALPQGLHVALNTANSIIALNLHDDGLTSHLPTASATGIAAAAITLDRDDTIVISGGARGIGAALARSLVGLGCKIILIGRTDPLSTTQQRDQTIAGLLAELQADGTPAHYFQCDVTDPEQVRTLAEKLKNLGAITGILHGAGILHDGFIPLLKGADFREVIEVKLAGLHNLTTLLPTENLKFVAVLSSLAAITGNVGQAGYCCANRMMAAALAAFGSRRQNCRVKTFWLPPIEGAGMAEDEDIKAMIKANVGENAFLHVEEIAEIIIRELRTGDRREQDIIPARELPPQMMVVAMGQPQYSAWHSTDQLDMIDGLVQVNWRRKSLLAKRTLEHTRDLWLKEHQPFPFLKQPITSAVMVVESFLEAASLLAPLPYPLVMEKIHFIKMLPAPLQQKTETFTLCREDRKRGIIDCSLGKIDRQADQFDPGDLDSYFNGRVVLSAAAALPFADLAAEIPAVTIKRPPLIAAEEMALCYQSRSGLTGRYRVLREICHCDARSISGKMIYPHLHDFTPPSKNSYLMPVYALEALLQLAGFHAGLQEKDQGPMVPTAIDRLLIVRGCTAGEVIDLQARLITSDDGVATWRAAASDGDGAAIVVAEIQMTRMA
jgi:NAD(P)-dependent dehydrogenase (short-subunit alcohol dehydrogenase family)/acyl carrier protein